MIKDLFRFYFFLLPSFINRNTEIILFENRTPTQWEVLTKKRLKPRVNKQKAVSYLEKLYKSR